MRQASGEAARRSRSRLQADRRTRRSLLIIGLALFGFVIAERLDRSRHGARAILRQRFARQNNVVLALFDGSAGAAIIRTAIVKTTAIFAGTLRRGVLRWRQVAGAALSVRPPIPIATTTTTATPAATPSKTSPASTASAIPVSAAISTAVTPAVISLRAIVADARRIAAGGVVAGRKILRGRSVRLRLTLVEFAAFGRLAFDAGITFALLVAAAKFSGGRAILTVAIFLARLVQRNCLFVDGARGEVFARQRFDQRAARGCGNRGRGDVTVGMSVIVVFEVFENVADVEEGVAVQADVDESRLHARKDARYFSLVDAADKRELLFALNVDLD